MNNGKGKFLEIHKDCLVVDHAYQREKVNQQRIRGIVSDFSWAAFGAVSVSARDSNWLVIDGQHRVLAAQRIKGVTLIPCMVFEHTSKENEAKSFLAANSNRSAVNAVTKYKAGILAKDAVALSVKESAEKLGYSIVEHASKPFELSCVGTLMVTESSEKEPKIVFDILKNIKPLAEKGVITSKMVRAFRVIHHSIDGGLENKHFQNRIPYLSLEAIDGAMHNESVLMNNSTPLIWATGIIKALNSNHRLKIKMTNQETAA